MRDVTVFEHWRPEGAKYTEPYQKRILGKGKFHQFSINYEDLEHSAGHFACAIVEMPDGNVITPAADMIRFDVETKA